MKSEILKNVYFCYGGTKIWWKKIANQFYYYENLDRCDEILQKNSTVKKDLLERLSEKSAKGNMNICRP